MEEDLSLGSPSRSDTNQAVQPQKMARHSKFCRKSRDIALSMKQKQRR